MDILNPSRQALNTLQASGADFDLKGRILKIGDTGNYGPDINYLGLNVFAYKRSQVAEPNRFKVTVTLSAGNAHSFNLQQLTDIGTAQGPTSKLVEYTAVSGDDLAAVLTKLKSIVDAYTAAGQLTGVTATISSPNLFVSGPQIECSAGEHTAVVAEDRTIALNATPATAIAGTSTVTVTTLAAHGLVTGNVVHITGATGSVFTNVDNGGKVSTGEIECTIAYATATTFTLRGVTRTGTNTGAATLAVVPSEAFGQGSDLLSKVVFINPSVLPEAGKTYVTVDCEYGNGVTPLNTIQRAQQGEHFVYLNEASANIEAALTRIREIQNAFVAGGTTTDPETIAVD
jgi:hypothetical protein